MHRARTTAAPAVAPARTPVLASAPAGRPILLAPAADVPTRSRVPGAAAAPAAAPPDGLRVLRTDALRSAGLAPGLGLRGRTDTAAVVAAEPPVHVLRGPGGLTVTLTGALGAGTAPALRDALLSTRAPGCDTVTVDGGAVSRVEPAALAVLWAAEVWGRATGAELTWVRRSAPLADALARRTAGALPQPRAAEGR